MTPTYSIIIPHHNIPRLLERCLASIPQRDDLEVIVIDDNSDPSIVDFQNFPGTNRHDLHVIYSKQGQYAGAARNLGIDAAQGKWLIFADADDFFTPCLPQILDKYANSQHDIIFFHANALDSELYSPSPLALLRIRHIEKYYHTYARKPHTGETLLRYAWGEPWAKIYNAQLIRHNNIRFDTTPIHEDTQFTYLAGHHARSIAVDPHRLYCVTYRPGSLSLSVSVPKLLARVAVFSRKEQFIKHHHIHYSDPIDNEHYAAIADAWLASPTLYAQTLKIAQHSLPNNLHFRLKYRFFILKKIVKKLIGWKK